MAAVVNAFMRWRRSVLVFCFIDTVFFDMLEDAIAVKCSRPNRPKSICLFNAVTMLLASLQPAAPDCKPEAFAFDHIPNSICYREIATT